MIKVQPSGNDHDGEFHTAAILARTHAELAIRTLVKTMRHGSPAARVNAAKMILKLAWGPPPNYPVEVCVLPSEIPPYPTTEEIEAEMERRGLGYLWERVDQEIERDRERRRNGQTLETEASAASDQ